MASQSSEVVVLWNFPESDHAAWLAAGCGTGSHEAYVANLWAAAAAAQAKGKRVKVVKIPVSEMLAALRHEGLPNTEEGRERAIRTAYLGGE